MQKGRLYYNATNPDGCDPETPFTDDWSGDPDDYLSPIILVDIGKCTFVQQTRNIEKNGGALAIIIDSKNEDITDLILSDDGTGQGIRIPAMLINKHEGELLKNFLKEGGAEAAKVSLTAEFQVEVREDNQVNVELWYTSSDDKSLDFIRNFREFVTPILPLIKFNPRAVTWACPHCEQDYKTKNCVSDGKYCAMQHDNNLHIDGKEIILENLRHICLNDFAQADKISNAFGKEIVDDITKRGVRTARQ